MEEVDLVNVLNRTCHPAVLPLKKITEFKVATILCNSRQLIRYINACERKKIFYFSETRTGVEFKLFSSIANEILSELDIGSYKDKILDWVWPVFFKMLQWSSSYGAFLRIPYIRHFYWTADCRIDNEKTVRNIIRTGMVSIETQFNLACVFCLVDEINNLWGEYQRRVNLQAYLQDVDIFSFWIRTLRDGDYSPEEHMGELLMNAIDIKSLKAVKHLFSIMPEHVKDGNAKACFNFIKQSLRNFSVFNEEKCRICYFVISQMTLENPYQFFRSSFEIVLRLLLYSGNQDEFLKVWKYGLCFDFDFNFPHVLDRIVWKRRVELYRDLDYRLLFVSAWQNLSDNSKTAMKETYMGVKLFCALIQEDIQFVLLINPFTDIELLIGSYLKKWSISDIHLSVKEDKWKLLHYLIEEEIVTINKFNEEKDLVKKLFRGETEIDACKYFLQFVSNKINARKKKLNNTTIM